MDYIYCKMFGNFNLTVNKEEIFFPYSKAQGLFCYLLLNKQDNREHISELFWANQEEGYAKKNLRNAIYKINKCSNVSVLVSPQKSMIMLNPNIEIDVDIYKFMSDENEIDVFKGEFLQGFCPKNAENFEIWILEMRENLQCIYRDRLNKKIEKEFQNNNYNIVEKYSKLLIKIDEFNENAYVYLLESYKKQGKYTIAIEAYNKIKILFKDELSISPNDKILNVVNEIVDIMNTRGINKNTDEFFYGRYNELRILQNTYNDFKKNGCLKSVLLVGEAGIGKTRLKDKFIEIVDVDTTYILETYCFQFEKDCILKPWNVILSKLSQIMKCKKIKIPSLWENIIENCFSGFNKLSNIEQSIKISDNEYTLKYELISNIITNILTKIAETKKVILIFEDIQWIDNGSLRILSSMILHCNTNILCFMTYRNEYNIEIDKFLVSANNHNKILRLDLLRFNNVEVENFIKIVLPKNNFNKEILNKIYNETEGNAFFLTEYINTIKFNSDINIMSSKMKDIMKNRFLDISEACKTILRISSLFFDEIPLYILHELTGEDELKIIDSIEELENKFILKEVTNNSVLSFMFTHQKLREFIYINLSLARRRILHNKIGYIIEKSLTNNKQDVSIYNKLVYHFSNANNNISTLKYSIKSLNVYLNFSHELYPVLYSKDVNFYNNLYFSNNKTIKSIKKIEILLLKIKNDYKSSKEVLRLEIEFLHIKGRYLIREGDYEKGVKFISEMIEKANEIDDSDYSIEGYKQMIYYCIQTNNIDGMIKYVNMGLDKAADCNYHMEIGVFLRFKALYKKMQGKYNEAEKLFNESINVFNVTKSLADKYALSIAAAYNYIGDIRRQNMKFQEALNFFEKAIKICEEKNILTSLSIFSINAGETCFNMGAYSKAKTYFQRAMDIYKQFDLMWEKSIVESFMSKIIISEGNYESALEYLKNSDLHSRLLKNPHEIGIVYMVKAQIKNEMKNNDNLNKIFDIYLNETLQFYCENSIKFLTSSKDNYEIDLLNTLMNKDNIL
ncbi:tetratricopeptide repeat protein [Clostridium estertheticum]|uniref:tetratricopeptide repeat protein n=1 Tax=Clostridium estertheticum TaxID=238834 RepID=UPI001CF2E1E1|nr:tetratricopeptide repeat protein [Clostridium estertheticum]MCB2355313.1 tetratricopeptide repeat protein [Clostridium estertheticum]WAG39594.1 tetratricopeptide repeat protein [Clostridium estertheticum]